MASSSSFSAHLGTNYAPSESEIASIQEFLNQSAPELSQLDAEVEAARQALAALQQKRDARHSSFAEHRALLSPIRRLPLDILQTIFMFCLPYEHNAVMSPSQAPLLLTQVCRQWRDLALNMPLLWSSIHIPLPRRPDATTCIPGGMAMSSDENRRLTDEQKDYLTSEIEIWQGNMEKRKDLVALWLERAEQSNLSVSIAQFDPGRDFASGDYALEKKPDPDVNTVISIVRKHASQLERLELAASHWIVCNLLSHPASKTPHLRLLKIYRRSTRPPTTAQAFHAANAFTIGNNQNGGTSRWLSPIAPLFDSDGMVAAPSLRSLSLKNITRSVLDMPVQWEALTDLRFSGYDADRFLQAQNSLEFTSSHALDLLEKCPNLRRCGLMLATRRATPWNAGPAPPEPEQVVRHVVMPHLEELDIAEYLNSPATNFMQSLELLSLRSVKYSSLVIPSAAKSSSLLTLLRNWGYKVKSLTFNYGNVTPTELVECLELVTNVEELTLKVNRSEHHPLPTTHHAHHFSLVIHQPDEQHQYCPAYFSNKVLAAMTPKDDVEDFLCPRLTSFTIHLSTAEFTEETLLEFIRARRHAKFVGDGTVAKLEYVKVQFSVDGPKCLPGDENDEEGWPLFGTLREDPDVDLDGLDADIRWPGYDSRPGRQLRSKTLAQLLWSPTYGLPQTVMAESSVVELVSLLG